MALHEHGHALVPLDIGADNPAYVSPVESFADPERPIECQHSWKDLSANGHRPEARPVFKLLALRLVLSPALTWLAILAAFEWLDSRSSARSSDEIADMPGAPFIVIALFVTGGVMVFPVLLLIAATAATFGPWFGFAYAGAGALASALVTYGLGALLGRQAIDGMLVRA